MSTPIVFVPDLTAEEAAAGFAVGQVDHPDGPPALVPAVTRSWGDPSHRLVKTRGRDGGIVFQLQAYGRRPDGARPLAWHAERFWPGCYGPAWVLDRLREHFGRPGYRPLIDIHVPPAEGDPANPAGPPALVVASN
jgi:hypothetical protein